MLSLSLNQLLQVVEALPTLNDRLFQNFLKIKRQELRALNFCWVVVDIINIFSVRYHGLPSVQCACIHGGGNGHAYSTAMLRLVANYTAKYLGISSLQQT